MDKLRKFSPVEFVMTFNVPMETEILTSVSRISDLTFIDDSYTLNVINVAYGVDMCVEFVKLHLAGLNEFCSTRKMTKEQIDSLARLIIAHYGYVNQYELCLFCAYVKMSKYGTFFDSIDPQKVMKFLSAFIDDRNDDISKKEAENATKKTLEIENNPRCITMDEYLKIHPEAQETLGILRP